VQSAHRELEARETAAPRCCCRSWTAARWPS